MELYSITQLTITRMLKRHRNTTNYYTQQPTQQHSLHTHSISLSLFPLSLSLTNAQYTQQPLVFSHYAKANAPAASALLPTLRLGDKAAAVPADKLLPCSGTIYAILSPLEP